MSTTPPETQQPAPTPPPQDARPEGVSEAEWAALGDPGKQALLRERQRATEAEHALAAARARPTPPPARQPAAPQPPAAPAQPQQQDPTTTTAQPGPQPDMATVIQQAVTAAVAPLQQRLDERDTQDAANAIRTAVVTAAGERFHDPNDAFQGIDLTAITDGQGRADQAKITEQLDKLLEAKPYLAKQVDGRRFAPPGAGPTPGGSTPPIDDRVKDVLGQMQKSTGLPIAPTS